MEVDNHFDQCALKERLFNDADLIKEIAGIFLEDTPLHIAELKTLLDGQDCDGVKKMAHKIKGAAANMSAELLQSIARKMEIAGEQRNYAELTEQAPALENAYHSLEKELSEFLNKL